MFLHYHIYLVDELIRHLIAVKQLNQLDIDFIKAQETSADTSAIVAKKQALRDYPAQAGISTAQNITDLKANWDTSVLGKSPYSS